MIRSIGREGGNEETKVIPILQLQRAEGEMTDDGLSIFFVARAA